MKTIQTRTTVAFLILVGSIAPAFAQGGGNRNGRGREGDNRSQQGRDSRGGDRQGGGEQSRQRQSQPQYQARRGNGQGQSYGREQRYQSQAYRPQTYRQQDYRQPAYRPQYNYRDSGMRWSGRGGYRGRYIPQNRFYGSFGRQNFFRFGRPSYYNGYSRFSYGGYGFRILDPLPTYWANDWYDSDDVYVDYENDGYYMYNRRYPGAGIAIGIDF